MTAVDPRTLRKGDVVTVVERLTGTVSGGGPGHINVRTAQGITSCPFDGDATFELVSRPEPKPRSLWRHKASRTEWTYTQEGVYTVASGLLQRIGGHTTVGVWRLIPEADDALIAELVEVTE